MKTNLILNHGKLEFIKDVLVCITFYDDIPSVKAGLHFLFNSIVGKKEV
jgi:hypothetical protein